MKKAVYCLILATVLAATVCGCGCSRTKPSEAISKIESDVDKGVQDAQSAYESTKESIKDRLSESPATESSVIAPSDDLPLTPQD